MIRWVMSVLAWMSQTANLFLLFGHHDRTVSARCYINRDKPGWKQAHAVINTIFFWEDRHCYKSHLSDIRYAQQVIAVPEPKDE